MLCSHRPSVPLPHLLRRHRLTAQILCFPRPSVHILCCRREAARPFGRQPASRSLICSAATALPHKTCALSTKAHRFCAVGGRRHDLSAGSQLPAPPITPPPPRYRTNIVLSPPKRTCFVLIRKQLGEAKPSARPIELRGCSPPPRTRKKSPAEPHRPPDFQRLFQLRDGDAVTAFVEGADPERPHVLVPAQKLLNAGAQHARPFAMDDVYLR